MKVTYTGRQEPLAPAQKRKLDAKLAKLGKLLDRRDGEREAHVILTTERHLKRAEITVNVYDHPMVGAATGGGSYSTNCAVIGAIRSWSSVSRLPDKVRRLSLSQPDSSAAATAPSERRRSVEVFIYVFLW